MGCVAGPAATEHKLLTWYLKGDSCAVQCRAVSPTEEGCWLLIGELALRLWDIRILASQNLWGNPLRYNRDPDFPKQGLDLGITELSWLHIQLPLKLYTKDYTLSLSIFCSPMKPNKTFFVSYQRGPLIFTLSFKWFVNCPQLSVVPLNCSAMPLSFLGKDVNQCPKAGLIEQSSSSPASASQGTTGAVVRGVRRWVSAILMRWVDLLWHPFQAPPATLGNPPRPPF